MPVSGFNAIGHPILLTFITGEKWLENA